MRERTQEVLGFRALRRQRAAALATTLCGVVVAMGVLLPWYHWEMRWGSTRGSEFRELEPTSEPTWNGTKGDFLGTYTLILGWTACAASAVVGIRDGRRRPSIDRALSLVSLLGLGGALALTLCDLAWHGAERPDLPGPSVHTQDYGILFTLVAAAVGACCASVLYRRTIALNAEDTGAGAPSQPQESADVPLGGRRARLRRPALLAAVLSVVVAGGVALPWYAERTEWPEAAPRPDMSPNGVWRVFGEASAGWSGLAPYSAGFVTIVLGLVACFAASRLFLSEAGVFVPEPGPGLLAHLLKVRRAKTRRWVLVFLFALGLAVLITLVDELWFFRGRERTYQFDSGEKFTLHWGKLLGIHLTLAAAIAGAACGAVMYRSTREVPLGDGAAPTAALGPAVEPPSS